MTTEPGGPPGPTNLVRDVRLAVMCSGESVAHYTHGIVTEIHRLVTASRAFDADQSVNPFAASTTQDVYWNLLRDLMDRDPQGVRTRAVVDVIAGASAGGINGVFLAKALARNRSLAAARDFWLDGAEAGMLARLWGSLRTMAFRFLRATVIRPGWRHAPLRTDQICRLLYDTLTKMDLVRGDIDGPTLASETLSLELFITLTDLDGQLRYIPATDQRVVDRVHEHVMWFSLDYASDQFGPEYNGALAFSAAATACLPGAFSPLSITDFRQFLSDRSSDGAAYLFDTLRMKSEFFPEYSPEGPDAANAYFIDGTVVDSFPVNHVLDAIARRSAGSEVRRWLVYIPPELAGGKPVDRHANVPGWLATLWEDLLGVTRSEKVTDTSLLLEFMRERMEYVTNLVEASFGDVRERLDRIVTRVLGAGALVGGTDVDVVMREVEQEARARLGSSYTVYLLLRLRTASQTLADVVLSLLGYAPQSAQTHFVQGSMQAWVRQRYPIHLGDQNHQDHEELADFLRLIDVQHIERRLHFIIQALNEQYKNCDDAMRMHLDSAKLLLYAFVDKLSYIKLPAVASTPVERAHVELFDDSHLAKWVAADRSPGAFSEQHSDEITQLVADVRHHFSQHLVQFDVQLWERLSDLTDHWQEAMRTAVVVRYLGFPIWDSLLLPFEASQGSLSAIRLLRISPAGATQLATFKPGKLRGVPIHSFGASFSRADRQNDYLWGRLDGAENLIHLLTEGTAEPVRYRAAFAAVLAEEEIHLASVGGLLAQVQAAVDHLGT